jgi:hypothetical protein
VVNLVPAALRFKGGVQFLHRILELRKVCRAPAGAPSARHRVSSWHDFGDGLQMGEQRGAFKTAARKIPISWVRRPRLLLSRHDCTMTSGSGQGRRCAFFREY